MYKMNKKGHPILEDEVSVKYESALGHTYWKFFEEFKKENIYGSKCPKCRRIIVPARSFCANCFIETNEWVKVSDEGEIKGWSLTNFHYFGMPVNPPFVSAYIQLDGADNELIHLIGGIDLSDINYVRRKLLIGTRVKAVWEKIKTGTIRDIAYFKII